MRVNSQNVSMVAIACALVAAGILCGWKTSALMTVLFMGIAVMGAGYFAMRREAINGDGFLACCACLLFTASMWLTSWLTWIFELRQ